MVTKKIREARVAYYNNKLEESCGDNRGVWNTLNTLLNRNSTGDASSKFIIEEHETSDENAIALKMNEYFSNVGKQLASEFGRAPLNSNEYLSYLGQPLPEAFVFGSVNE